MQTRPLLHTAKPQLFPRIWVICNSSRVRKCHPTTSLIYCTPAFPRPHPCSLVYNPSSLKKHVLLMIPLGRKQLPSSPRATKDLQMPQWSSFTCLEATITRIRRGSPAGYVLKRIDDTPAIRVIRHHICRGLRYAARPVSSHGAGSWLVLPHDKA